MQNIIKPIITEKTVNLANNFNQYTFEVSLRTNKIMASHEVSKNFGVNVIDAKVHNRLGKTKYFGNARRRRPGKLQDKKIMIFTLKSGDKIDLFQL